MVWCVRSPKDVAIFTEVPKLKNPMKKQFLFSVALALPFMAGAQVTTLSPNVLLYGTENLLGTGTYNSDPTAGATLVGLAPGAVTFASLIQGHGFPFSPAPGDYPGTDQIYVGSDQTAYDDGYSQSATRIAGPQIVSFDYSSLVPAGTILQSLTLGIASDDFQNAAFGNPFTATINGQVDTALTATLNSLNETGPVTQLFTIGIDPSTLTANDVLNLTIDEGGNGGDGWAEDYFTVGVTTESVPEPSSWFMWAAGMSTLAGVAPQILSNIKRKRN
jgi:hypothetical protein